MAVLVSGSRARREVIGVGRSGGCHGDVVLARTATRALAGNDDTGNDELATPDAPRLAPGQRLGEAPGPQRAGDAEGLGGLDVGRGLGEEQVRVLGPTRQNS